MEENKKKCYRLVATLAGILAVPGFLIGGVSLALIMAAMAGALGYFAYYYSDTLVMRMFRAVKVEPSTDLYRAARLVAKRAGVPMPKIYIMNCPQPNAFSTGRDPRMAKIAVTSGMLEKLSSLEVSAIIAHELAHIQHGDTQSSAMSAFLAGGISMPSNLLMFNRDEFQQESKFERFLIWVFANLAALLVKRVVEAESDFAADAEAAAMIEDPEMLISALKKTERYARQAINIRAEKIPAASFMFTVNPLSGQGADDYFMFHPTVEERVNRLQVVVPEYKDVA